MKILYYLSFALWVPFNLIGWAFAGVAFGLAIVCESIYDLTTGRIERILFRRKLEAKLKERNL